MRQSISLCGPWQFTSPKDGMQTVTVPHTWNAEDGQDGGNDYWRGTCVYEKSFVTPAFDPVCEEIWLECDGVNASATVYLNGSEALYHHDGGYSRFRVKLSDYLLAAGVSNTLRIEVDNSVNDQVYPQIADFTFYGGIYRNIRLLVVPKTHFALGHFGSPGFQVTGAYHGNTKHVHIRALIEQSSTSSTLADYKVVISLFDMHNTRVATGEAPVQPRPSNAIDPVYPTEDTQASLASATHVGTAEAVLTLENPHLWQGTKDPYLYTAELKLCHNNQLDALNTSDGSVLVELANPTLDCVSTRFGIRTFSVDPDQGFILNGVPYPLHGVSRHQDRRGLGNALSPREHEEDMQLIRELGANTLRLAHYQHAEYFYDLCDAAGLVVWAEIPYISKHMPPARKNTISQMRELILQNYNHASICFWGVSNEITIIHKHKQDMLDNHHVLNDLAHHLDPTRLTTLACFAMCSWFNKSAHITDLVSWNLYLGWYVPGLFLNKLWFGIWRLFYRKRAVGMSEYGCEGMPNLHSETPRRNDHTEEYQANYHEYMLRLFSERPYIWATHVWNMFDFAADARNQGGEPGMNHKGLVTFDRSIKKDAFYIYKAWWSDTPFVHICSKRFVDRTQQNITVKVYSNQAALSLYQDGKLLETKQGDKIFTFSVALHTGENHIEVKVADIDSTTDHVVDSFSDAIGDHISDSAVFKLVDQANPSYVLSKDKNQQKSNWV